MFYKKNFKNLFLFLLSIICFIVLSSCNYTQNLDSVNSTENSTSSTKSNDKNNSTQSSDKLLKVSYIDVGQADSILIQSPDGFNMLIDAGETKDGAIINYLNSCDIKRLDVVVATHPHEDHISEMPSVIRTFDIGDFYMPKKQHTTKIFEKMIDALSEAKISPKEAKAGVSFNLGKDVKCNIVAPCKDNYEDLNNWSAVIKVTYGENSFLFTGDAESLSEKEIIESGADIKADVLKIGHHGSRSSTSEEFLQKVIPESIVISAGKDNDYGHPHKETMDKLYSFGIEDIFITYEEGTIIATSDGKYFHFNVWDKWAEKANENNSNTSEKTDNVSNTKYIGNKNSKKFHISSCSNLPSEKNKILFNSKEEAQNLGYSPCGVCKP